MLTQMELFYYVVKSGNFSKAAEQLHVSKSYLSKTITQLEQELKARLLTRTTRKITLTEAGKNFYQYCIQVMQTAEQGYNVVNELQQQPTGMLKISVPPAFGFYVLPHIIKEFSQQYPEVQLNIMLESRLVDIVGEGYDLVIRSAKLKDSNLIAQKFMDIKYVVCGTPDYFKKHSRLEKPKDLLMHNCGIYLENNTWNFIKNGHKEKITVTGNLRSNQLEIIKQQTLNGLCVAYLPEFMIKQEIKQKKLQIALPHYKAFQQDFYLIYPTKEFVPFKVRVFIQLIKSL